VNNDELELNFQEDEVDLSLTQVNISTQYGTLTFYTPSSYTKDEFDIHVDGVFTGLSLAIELLTGHPAKVYPVSQTEEDVE